MGSREFHRPVDMGASKRTAQVTEALKKKPFLEGEEVRKGFLEGETGAWGCTLEDALWVMVMVMVRD